MSSIPFQRVPVSSSEFQLVLACFTVFQSILIYYFSLPCITMEQFVLSLLYHDTWASSALFPAIFLLFYDFCPVYPIYAFVWSLWLSLIWYSTPPPHPPADLLTTRTLSAAQYVGINLRPGSSSPGFSWISHKPSRMLCWAPLAFSNLAGAHSYKC